MLLAVMAHYADDEHGIALNRAGFGGGSNSSVGWSIMSKTTNKFSLQCASGPCGWFWTTRRSIRRAGKR